MMRILIGVDVGGTKTAAAVSDGERILARADGPGAPVRPGRALASASTIAEVVRTALAEARRQTGDILLVGAAGAGREQERDELQKALRAEGLASTVVVKTDIELALAAAFPDRPGIVVSAGTGSVAVGRDRHGHLHRIGGYGWQMGDEGSGYAIGRAALGAVSRAADQRSPKTALTERILAVTRSADFDALIRWAAGASPAEVAALAPHVLVVAGEGDVLAQGIADYAARELSQLALCLAPTMDVSSPVEVAFAGGLLSSVPLLRQRVFGCLSDQAGFQPIETAVDAVAGALHLAAAVTEKTLPSA